LKTDVSDNLTSATKYINISCFLIGIINIDKINLALGNIE